MVKSTTPAAGADMPVGTSEGAAAGTPSAPTKPQVRAHGVGLVRALVRASHPRLGVLVAVGAAVGAAAAGREPREVALVLATVLVGQAILGWHNDLVDRGRDAEHQVAGKPLADGRLEPGTVWFAVACAVLLLVPLGVTNGITAGTAYLLSVLVGVLGNVVLRTGLLSWVTWAASFALLPAFLSYGGWGGQHVGDPPRVDLTVAAAALGVGVHLVVAVWGLVPDAAGGWRSLPLRLGTRIGSTALLVVGGVVSAGALAAIIVLAATGGLTQ
jgi:hypothetical protein